MSSVSLSVPLTWVTQQSAINSSCEICDLQGLEVPHKVLLERIFFTHTEVLPQTAHKAN